METNIKHTRRAFFRNAITSTLPIIGLLALSIFPIKAKALHTNCTDGSCQGSCSGSCYGSCSGSCSDSCSGCTGSCSGQCSGQCANQCKH